MAPQVQVLVGLLSPWGAFGCWTLRSWLAGKSTGSHSDQMEWRCHRQGSISRYTVVVELRYRSVIRSQARAVRVGGGRREVGSRSFQIQIGGEGGMG